MKLTIWSVDVSTFMTLGSPFVGPGQPIPDDFHYEPWHSCLEMLEQFWQQADWPQALVALTVDPWAGDPIIEGPGLDAKYAVRRLHDHWPAGWYGFTELLDAAMTQADRWREEYDAVEIVAVNRGPAMDHELRELGRMAVWGWRTGTPLHVVPMGNEPGRWWRFPYLEPLKYLAESTGGRVFYRPNLEDVHDFSMLPALVPEMLEALRP